MIERDAFTKSLFIIIAHASLAAIRLPEITDFLSIWNTWRYCLHRMLKNRDSKILLFQYYSHAEVNSPWPLETFS